MSIQASFIALNPTQSIPKQPKVIDITGKANSTIVNIDTVQFTSGDSCRTMLIHSRVKPGISVSLTLTERQVARRPLDPLQLKYVDEIYATISTLPNSHQKTITSMFGQPFNITLIKNTEKYSHLASSKLSKTKKVRTAPPGLLNDTTKQSKKQSQNTVTVDDMNKVLRKKAANDSGDDDDDPEGESNRSESQDHPFIRSPPVVSNCKPNNNEPMGMDDIINTIKMDHITEKLIIKYWLPFLKSTEVYRLKYGIAPLYFIQVEDTEESYIPVPKKKYTSKQSTVVADNAADALNHPLDVLNTDTLWNPGDTNASQLASHYFARAQPNPMNNEATGSFRESKGSATDYGKLSTYVTPTNSSKSGEVTKTYGDKSYGFRTLETAADLLGIPQPKSTDPKHIPDRNIVYNDQLGECEMSTMVKTQSDARGGEQTIGMADSFIPGTALNGYPVEKIQERKLKDNFYSAQSATIDFEDNKRYSKLLHQYERDAQNPTLPPTTLRPGKNGAFLPQNEDSKVSKTKTSDSGTPPADQLFRKSTKRKRSDVSIKDSTTAPEPKSELLQNYKMKRIYTKTTHYVPVSPAIEQGTIEIYEDLDGIKYLWTWRTNDKCANSIEPYMMWCNFNPPKLNGILTSVVSTMIGDYQDYLSAKHEYELSTRRAEIPNHAVEYIEPRSQQSNAGVLGGENYVAMTGAGSMDMDPNEARMSLDLDGFGQERRAREQMYHEHSHYTRPRGYLREDGPNGSPPWDHGRLTDGMSYQQEHSSGLGHGATNILPPLSSMTTGASSTHQNHSSYHLMDQAIAQYQHKAQLKKAEYTSWSLNRHTVYTPDGNYIFLRPNEKIVSIEQPAPVNPVTVNERKTKLELQGAILGGSPNMMSLGKSSSKGGVDGVFTSKTVPGSASEYGYNMSNQQLSPTKEENEKYLADLRAIYSNTVQDAFKLAYRDVFKSQEKWYKNIVANTFQHELNAQNQKNAYRIQNKKAPRNVRLPQIPQFETLFTISVIIGGTVVGVSRALDLYKIGFFDVQQVYLECLHETPSAIKHADYLQLISETSNRSDQTHEHKIERLKQGLDGMIKFEIDKASKPDKVQPKKPAKKKAKSSK